MSVLQSTPGFPSSWDQVERTQLFTHHHLLQLLVGTVTLENCLGLPDFLPQIWTLIWSNCTVHARIAMLVILFFCTDFYGNDTQKQNLVILFQNNPIREQPRLPHGLQPRRCLHFIAGNNGVSWEHCIPVPDLPLMYIT